MRAVLPADDSRSGNLRVGDLPDPVPGPGEILIDIEAAGVNHAELLQVPGYIFLKAIILILELFDLMFQLAIPHLQETSELHPSLSAGRWSRVTTSICVLLE